MYVVAVDNKLSRSVARVKDDFGGKLVDRISLQE